MQWWRCTRQKGLGLSIEVWPPQSLLSFRMLVSSSPPTTSCNSFLNGWFQLKKRKEVGTWDSDVCDLERKRGLNASLGDWHKLSFLCYHSFQCNIWKVSQFPISHCYSCTHIVKISTVKFTSNSCYGITVMEMQMDGKVKCHRPGYSSLSCVTLLILWEDNAGVIFLSVSLVLWGQDSCISSGNLPADSSTAVTEEDSFSLI